MIPPAPLTDDWLYWDPVAVASYPHSTEDAEPQQLDLFHARDRSTQSPRRSPAEGEAGTA